MFDIGFWEITLVAVIALLVVGPDRFPGLINNAGKWLGRARRVMNSVKEEFEQEVNKAEELKRLATQEMEISARHKENESPQAVSRPSLDEKDQTSIKGAADHSPQSGEKKHT